MTVTSFGPSNALDQKRIDRVPRALVPEIQALRALAVTLVLVYHLWPGALPGGFIGVDVFFVISGFLITGHLIREHERSGAVSLAHFYVRRVRRIAPMSLLVIAVTSVAALALLAEPRWDEVSRTGVASVFSATNWVLAADSVDYLAEGTAPGPFQHYWSLAVEEQFYLVWPVLVIAAALAARVLRVPLRWGVAVLACTAIGLSLTASVQAGAAADPAGYFVTTTRAWELGIGALLACAAPRAWSARRRTAVLVAATGVIVVTAFALTGSPAYPGQVALVPCLAAGGVLAAGSVGGSGAWARSVGSRPVQWLGDVSFSLYLWHWPLIVLLPGRPWIVLVAALVLAGLSRRFVELPFLHPARRTSPGHAVAALTVACLVTATLAIVPWFVGQQQAEQRAQAGEALLAASPPSLGPASLSPSRAEPFVPGTTVIMPSPERARDELPTGAEGRCKSDMGSPTTPVCHFGAPAASTVVAVVGDSHIEQYLPAFEDIAARHDVRVQTYLHASCPFSTAQRQTDAVRGGPCLAANRATLAALVADPAIDVVVTSNRTAVEWVDRPGVPTPEDGFAEVWQQLDAAGLPVVVLSDNPLMLPADATLDCVASARTDPSVCARPRDAALPVDHQIEPALATPGVTLVDTSGWFCTADTCPAVIGSLLVHRDEQHLTTAYARALSPQVWDAVTGALAR